MPSPSWAFLLDENMPKRAATALRRAGYSAARVVEVGLRARKDPVIFAYARARGLIIVTRDADFLVQEYLYLKLERCAQVEADPPGILGKGKQ